jgi:hypothetical protein
MRKPGEEVSIRAAHAIIRAGEACGKFKAT